MNSSENFQESIYDKHIYKSIINTSREFKNLTIILPILPNFELILNIVAKFGERIKKFTLRDRKDYKTEVLESNLAKMLNCIFNVEDLTLENVYMNWNDELDLHNLKKLKIKLEFDGDIYDDDFNRDNIENIIFEQSMRKFLQIKTLSIVAELGNYNSSRDLRLCSGLFEIINTILKYFTKLETFQFVHKYSLRQEFLFVDEDLKHENLKKFAVSSINSRNKKSILNAIRACPYLEIIEISKIPEIAHEDLQQILDDHPKLICLTLEMDNFNFQIETYLDSANFYRLQL
ncbi:CLUMA_CG014002, isoform A [Clunio marinus]|uniref:CLUMA_CG014002, isoform A n=1 Tax=Clunio marinus TaxID=568069 RepID=A0A1J1ILW9_9DIPT|nr:CLUMA_CG014002, isoform A [Clunio marinus]